MLLLQVLFSARQALANEGKVWESTTSLLNDTEFPKFPLRIKTYRNINLWEYKLKTIQKITTTWNPHLHNLAILNESRWLTKTESELNKLMPFKRLSVYFPTHHDKVQHLGRITGTYCYRIVVKWSIVAFM